MKTRKNRVHAYRVENLNSEKGILSAMRVDEKNRKYVVVLCLPNTIKQTTFPSRGMALDQMQKYRELYHQIKK